ncbi:hypothetical protein [Lewinella sp. W8]|uniref:MutS-related protein n=1 Tax=Lewinella sp. W8 TaxID=2528208 RepID=UPI001068BB29|nr:hypothetical protein [Lewinella sp. W8]MTB49744.1 hypothetical protein [Lewinella sp. W8]
MSDPSQYYQTLWQSASTEAAYFARRYERFSLIRLFLVLAWVAGLILVFSWDWRFGLLFFALSVPVIARGVRWHRSLERASSLASIRAKLARAELQSLEHDFSAWEDGSTFLHPQHPYALDLDVFGPHSLFQFLNRTVTAPGQAYLAEQLLVPAKEEAAARTQVQSIALAAVPDWCIEFRALGDALEDTAQHQQRLLAWLDRPAVVEGRWDKTMLWLAVPLTLISIAWMLFMPIWQLGVLFLVPTFLQLRKYKERIEREHAYVSEMGKLLGQYADLLAQLESAPEVVQPKANRTPSIPAMRRLGYLISQLDVRYNPFVILLEVSGLWSLQWLSRLDAWRESHRAALPGWLETMARTDALVSWATLRFNQPEWTDAEWTREPLLEASELGHPLLHPSSRVTNDIRMRTDGHIQLVTGSNMAGKSTWLRTVGVNLVLMQAGGPVCARHLRSGALNVWTSMRTQDDLSESTSSFYAELKRLKAIIEAVADPQQQVFFLLDEILKGTNSRDRHTGARALIRQLIRDLGAGIIATHDLELAALEGEPGSKVENYAMEVQTEGDQLTFDYKLHRGVSKSFNATALMARMGIEIPPDEIKLHHD